MLEGGYSIVITKIENGLRVIDKESLLKTVDEVLSKENKIEKAFLNLLVLFFEELHFTPSEKGVLKLNHFEVDINIRGIKKITLNNNNYIEQRILELNTLTSSILVFRDDGRIELKALHELLNDLMIDIRNHYFGSR